MKNRTAEPSRRNRVFVIPVLITAIGTAAAAGTVAVGADQSHSNSQPEGAAATCKPNETSIISASGVLSIVPSTCPENSVGITVPAVNGPWDQTVNTSLVYAESGEDPQPKKITLSTYSILPGNYIALQCVSGTMNGGGLPNSGCAGLLSSTPTNNRFQPACGSYYPSSYVDASNYPIYSFQVIGAFANFAGVVVGTPFVLTPKVQFFAVPVGAEVLQLGVDDCRYSDNSGSLSVRLWY